MPTTIFTCATARLTKYGSKIRSVRKQDINVENKEAKHPNLLFLEKLFLVYDTPFTNRQAVI
ncbi:hypothetical protein SBDP1_360005 [Syntrophobacter sp. SbD1]|nr:hypothetical protein SBDP1_360005 [Syntrophobacter sp. SbD1]